MSQFDILQWNCRGLRARVEQLKVLMKEHNPGAICLQETMLGNANFNPGLNYDFYSSPPPPGDRAHGGAAIIVSKALQHSPVILNTQLQAVAISVILDKQITICSLYLPPDPNFNVSFNDIQFLINQLPVPFLILGDFNAHNPLWGGSTLNDKGRVIEAIIDSNPVTLYNDGSMTFHNIHLNQLSAIDLSLCSSSITLDFNWSVNEFLNGSDHFPIHLKYAINTPTESPPKWKVEEADWVKYSICATLEREFDSFESHIQAYEYFIEGVLDSANASIPKTKGKPRRPVVPWWNRTCGILRRITRKTYRKYKTNGSSQSKVIYQRAMAKQRRYFKKVKKESWLYYINGINSKTPSRAVWRKIRKLTGKFVPSPIPKLRINDNLISDPDKVANELGKHFSGVSSPKNYSPHFQKIRNTQVALDFSSKDSEAYNAKFSLRELKEALSSTEVTAPGEDTILYQMLKHLPESSKSFLLKIINKIWETGILPESWKLSLIIPVIKPNKDPLQATSYRPIALTSCVCKLVEKMINTRLVWYLETEGLLSPFQFGFRKNRSTLDPLLQLSNQIQQGFASKCQTIGVFFDLEKAYDTTWRYGIVKQLYKMGICGNMIRFIQSFLSNRYLKVKVGNSISSPFLQEEGVPQGSVLSVTLFAVAINSILEEVSPPVKGSLFVDDLAVYVTSYDAVSACNFLQKSINKINKWANENGFKFSASKTVAVRFTRSTRKETVPNLILNDNLIPYEKEVKFLGMIFDSKLTWASHIDFLKIKVKKSLNILKVVAGFDWGADKKSLLRLYDSLCRSKLEYGCQIYSSACATKLKDLDVVHHTGLRICSGAFKTSPVESLYVEADELPLDLRREELGLRYAIKLRGTNSNPAANVFKSCDPQKFESLRASKPFPVRVNAALESDSIRNQKIKEVGYPKFPPWLTPEPSVCNQLDLTKKSMSDQEMKMRFLDHDIIHSDSVKLYTDGSKSPDGVGCAVIHNENYYVGRMSDNASIFTAELTALSKSLEVVSTLPGTNFTIYSDSKSALMAIKQFNSCHPIVQKVQEWLHRLASKFKCVHFCWVPAHVGIPGNELADQEAKAVVRDSIIFYHIPYTDMKNVIHSYIKSKWQARWSSQNMNTSMKYKKIRDSVNHWPTCYHSNRKTEVKLCRLRIGHAHFSHSFLLKGEPAPVCQYCDSPLTVEHVLVDCPQFSAVRQRHRLAGRNIKDILGENVDSCRVLRYLQDIGFYGKI